MANSLAAAFGRKAFRVTNLTNNSPVLGNVNVAGVAITFSSRLMTNRDEEGRTVVDARVIMPTTIAVKAIVDSIDTLNEINHILLDTESVYSIMSRGIYVRNFVLAEDNIAQVPEMLSANAVEIKFTQLLLGDNKNVCEQDGDSETVFKGIINSVDGDTSVTQLVDKIEPISDFSDVEVIVERGIPA